MGKEEKFLTTSEVAKRFGINERTVRRHIEKNLLPAIVLHSRHWLIKESDIVIYIDNLKKSRSKIGEKLLKNY